MNFLFENHRLDIRRRELRRGPDIVSVEPQVFDLLVFLVENRERVVSKDDLIAAVWDGRAISDSTLTSRINAARKAVGDNGKDQRLIRTVPRKGFRFICEVETGEDAAPGRAMVAEAFPAVIADRPSIAVLPLENLSDDRTLELIANGLAEDIIALLARVPGFFVIARASSLAYRPGATEVRQVAQELGVRYVVTGSARSSDQRVRVAVQLIEAETGNQLWAGRYDVERGDTLELQDEIARQIIVELEPALTKADLQVLRRRRTENFDAWSHYRHGAGAISVNGWNEDSVAEAKRRLHLAIENDPNFALAYGLLALVNAFGANLSLVPDPEGFESIVRENAERAVELDPSAPDVLGFAGCALADIGEQARGVALLQRALELDPSNAQAHVAIGACMIRAGQFDEGIESMKFGLRSSPRDFRLTFWMMILADALGRAGRTDEALEVATSASRRDGRLYGTRVISALMLKRLSRLDAAREAVAEARRIRPALNLEEVGRFFGKRAAAELSPIWNEQAPAVV